MESGHNEPNTTVPGSTQERRPAIGTDADESVDIWQLARALWDAKWIVIGAAALFACAALAYSLLATKWWRVEVLLAPVEERRNAALDGQLGGLGGLASLAGLNIGGNASPEPLAILRSRDFSRGFIADNNLIPLLFAGEWDAERQAWKETDPRKVPDLHDAVKYFQEDILDVSQDRQTKLVKLTIEWTDPEVAAQWAAALTDRINLRMRARAVDRAEENLAYLRSEYTKTDILPLREAIGRMMESEMQSLMLARGSTEFAFRTLEPAVAPKLPVRPRAVILVPLGVALGIFVGVGLVVIRLLWHSNRMRSLSA
jgi:LPS O-antigen subunit length determinant protein (WzzB/FepE family)